MKSKNPTKGLELAILLFLLVFSFFAGVNYSDAVKNHASWLFEPKEEEIELPDLSKESGSEFGAVVDENGENLGTTENNVPAAVVAPQNIQQNQISPAVKE
jgi:hypothetical protein